MITTIAIDLAKSVFELAIADENGKVIRHQCAAGRQGGMEELAARINDPASGVPELIH
jgi:hypothetical protein